VRPFFQGSLNDKNATYMKEENKIFKGATALGLGTLVAKLLGAVYRIPLTSVLGSYGLGLYQMIFPVYTLLLDV
jgi:stage V sporulation protein B